jgi:hypothetical protein
MRSDREGDTNVVVFSLVNFVGRVGWKASWIVEDGLIDETLLTP